VLIDIKNCKVENDRLIIEDRNTAFRIALSILTILALNEKINKVEDDRPVWPGKV
jgi:hypothetical protein